MAAPKIFVSYSYDSQQHKDWVRKLATGLRVQGIDAVLDQWDLTLGQDMAAFMATGIRKADRVLLICSEAYVAKAEAGMGGVGYERLVVTGEVVAAIDTIKFIPVVRSNAGERKVPDFLGARKYVDFSDDALYEEKLEELAREILRAPAAIKPPLGENPFKSEVIQASEPVRIASPSGATANGAPILSGDWFNAQLGTASWGIRQLHVDILGQPSRIDDIGTMEVRFGLHSGLNKTQIELLNAVRVSTIKTFGWPFAVLLESRNEFKPQPFGDGIRAEISINDEQRKSYDYWSASKSGDFYAMQSFFEDQRVKNAVFFDTRIVRVTEALLFASKFYTELGAAPDAKISVRVTHRGLSGRTLKNASVNRPLYDERTTGENVSETESVVVLGHIREALVDEVQRICAPMFMLFDFHEFALSVYEDIVRGFEQGKIT